jgi:hypothetical protein
MTNRKISSFEEVEKWALAHGFKKTSDNVLTAPYGEVSVQIELLIRDIRVSMVSGEQVQRLITAYPGHLHIDENDMLQGAGLFSRFYTNYRDDYRDDPEQAVKPVWFGESVRAMISEHVSNEAEKARISPV